MKTVKKVALERRALRPGDTIKIGAVSDAVGKVDVERSGEIVSGWGLVPELDQHIFDKVHDFSAGEPKTRYEVLLAMLSRAYGWFACGGYAADDLTFPYDKGKRVIQKWRETGTVFAGYSDMTLFAAMAHTQGLPFVMGSNYSSLNEWDKKTHEMMKEVWMGSGRVDINSDARWTIGNPGVADGKLFSGNLSVMTESLMRQGAEWLNGGDFSQHRIVLATEDLRITEIDVLRRLRDIFSHENAFRKIAGLIVGRMSEVNRSDYPNFSKAHPLRERIKELVLEFNPQMPLAFCEDFGHAEWGWGWDWRIKRLFAKSRTFYPMTNGLDVKFEVRPDGECSLKYNENLWQ